MNFSRSLYAKVAVAALALAAAGAASVAQARSDVYFSAGAQVAPGVNIGISNAPVYYPPVYVQPAPVYVRPAPVYYGAPVYYVRPAPVYYGAPAYYSGGHWKHDKQWKHSGHGHHGHGHGHGHGHK